MAALTAILSSPPHPFSLLQHNPSSPFFTDELQEAILRQSHRLWLKEQKKYGLGRSCMVGSCLYCKGHKISAQNFRVLVYNGRDYQGKVQISRSRVVAQALPPAVSAAVAVFVIGTAVVAISRVKKEGVESPQLQKKECETCQGSGICSSCGGEGFLLKVLSPEASAKARANAKDAATRYTAGLPNKWRYCTTCSGSRNCLDCEGRGWRE